MVLLTVLTIVLILLLVAVLVVGLVKIDAELEAIGGSSLGYMMVPSLLSKARWGVRAIERHTASIEPHVSRLGEGLAAIDESLTDVEAGVGGVVDALERQGGDR